MTVLYFLGAVLILGLVVVVHEFGHFISARMLGIDVLEFAVGMGPKIWSKQHRGTLFSIRAIPVGGFCKYVGEDDGDYKSPHALNNQRPWKRFITVASGPLMNFVLALVVAAVYFMLLGTPSTRPEIAELTPGFPAEAAGLQVGDRIAAVDGEDIPYSEQGAMRMRELIGAADPEQGVLLTVDRDGAQTQLQLVPVQDPSNANGRLIGIVMGQARVRIGPLDAVRSSWLNISMFTGEMLTFVRNLIFRGEGLNETAGPVGMLDIMTKEIAGGWDQVFNLIVLISLNLGIMNLLPLPALDGGRLVFIAVEAIIRRPIKPEFEGWVHAGGFLLLMGFIVFITYKDIARLIAGA